MPSWNQVLNEIEKSPRKDALDYVRLRYLRKLQKKTGRNVISYYSGFLQKQEYRFHAINDGDKNGFMSTIHGLDRSKGLDLVLHTPGGDIAATESIVDYLRKMFGTDIRAVIPQLAMSAGTMIACACREIIMGKQSNIGPIDPQFSGIAAQGVLEEFRQAIAEVKADPGSVPIWQAIIGKYHPTFIGDCQKAVDLSEYLVMNWLISGMFKGDPAAAVRAKQIVDELGSHSKTKVHARHVHVDEAKALGLTIKTLEDDFDDEYQDLVLTIHHTYMHTFTKSSSVKIFENHTGQRMVLHHRPQGQQFVIQ